MLIEGPGLIGIQRMILSVIKYFSKFSQIGKADACTVVCDHAGCSWCFVFLTFDDPASMNA
ncbi:hypothetical protein JOM56_003235, partial [Amanita muscaria]